jgi:hypothetical protein
MQTPANETLKVRRRVSNEKKVKLTLAKELFVFGALRAAALEEFRLDSLVFGPNVSETVSNSFDDVCVDVEECVYLSLGR